MAIKFEGKKLALKIEDGLKSRVSGQRLVILQYGDEKASNVYVSKKREFGEEIGVEVVIDRLEEGSDHHALFKKIEDYGYDKEVTGIMVQLPIPGFKEEEVKRILSAIPLRKDVDGLNPSNIEAIRTGDQSFVPATVKAVGKILDEAVGELDLDIMEMKVGIVGAKGSIGGPLCNLMERFTMNLVKLDEGDDLGSLRDCNVVISAVGKEGLISGEYLSEKMVLIDVGYPKADFDESAYEKASFYTPVPGGVGPVTVACLFENLILGPAD